MDFTLDMDVDAPTYVNFGSLDDDSSENAENYFVRNGHQTVIKQEVLTPPTDQSCEEIVDSSGIYSSLSQLDNSTINNSVVSNGGSNQTKEQLRHRRSSSVPVLNRVKLKETLDTVKDLSDRLEDCNISKNKSHVNLNKSAHFRSKNSINCSSSKIKQHRSRPTAANYEGRLMNKFMSTAELIHKFETDTPKRYRTVSSRKDAKVLLQNMAKKPLFGNKTKPKSPKLRTKNRKRLNTAISFEMREEMEYQEMKKYKMKARPLNKDVMLGRTTSCNVQKRPTTKPEPFKLTEIKQKPITQVTENFIFTAKPVPRCVIEGQGVKSKVPKKPPTVPVTPNILKHKKKTVDLKLEQMKAIKEENSSKSLPLKRTIVQPFSFEHKYKEAIKKREQKINQMVEEEKRLREFHSKPMPVFKTPEKHKPPHNTVVAVSPKFASKELMIEKQQKFKLKLEEEERARKKAAEFKAKPCVVIYKQPFQPEIVDKPAIETEDFQLQCEIRAKQRQEFEAQCKFKQEKKLEAIKKEEQLMKEREAQQNIELRKMTIHRAQPIRKYKPVKPFEGTSLPETSTIFSKHSYQSKDN